MPRYYGAYEFTKEQKSQINLVHNCVVALLDSMLAVPDYLEDSNLRGIKDFEDAPIPESEIANMVAEYLVSKHCGNVFYPTRVKDDNAEVEWIQDTYNDREVYDTSKTNISNTQWGAAENYLHFHIGECLSENPIDMNKFNEILIPLKQRFNSGERSIELFNAIKSLEY